MDLSNFMDNLKSPKKLRQLCIALYLIIVLINLLFLKLPYRLIADESSYMELSHIIAYGEDPKDGWELRNYFFPAILSLSQIPNKVFGLTSPEEKILTFRIFIILFTSLIFWATYLLGAELFSRKAGIITAILISVTNIWVSNSLHVMMDTVVTVFVVFSFYFFIKGFRNPNKGFYIIFSAIAFGCAVMTKFAAGIFLFSYVLLVFHLTNSNEVRRKNVTLFVIFSIIMFIIYCLIDLFTFGEILHSFKEFVQFNFIDKSFSRYSPWGLNRTPFDIRIQFFTTVIPVTILTLMIVGLLETFKKDRILFFIFFPFTLIFFTTFYVEGSRYFIPVAPFATMLAVVGLLSSGEIISQWKTRHKKENLFIAPFVLLMASICLALFINYTLSLPTISDALSSFRKLDLLTLLGFSLVLYFFVWIVFSWLISASSNSSYRSVFFYDSLTYLPSLFLLLVFTSDRLSYNLILLLSTVALILLSKIFIFKTDNEKMGKSLAIVILLITFHLPLGLIEPFVKGKTTEYEVAIELKERIQNSPEKLRIGIIGYIAFPRFFFEPHRIHKFKDFHDLNVIRKEIADGWEYLLISKEFKNHFQKTLKENNYKEITSYENSGAFCFKKQVRSL